MSDEEYKMLFLGCVGLRKSAAYPTIEIMGLRRAVLYQLFEQLNDPYIDTNSSHFISFDPYLTYDKDTDGIYVVFDIPDHEIDNNGSYYPLEYLNGKFCEGFEFQYENDIGVRVG